MAPSNFQALANFIWSVADLLRGPYRPPQYERVMLPLTVLRRFDAVLAHTKEEVLRRHAELTAKGIVGAAADRILNELAKDEDGRPLGFHNHSALDFRKLKGDPNDIARQLSGYIDGFSKNVYSIFERFEFSKEIEKLDEANRLYQVIAQFVEIDLHPSRVDNITMGLVFEDLIRRFNEAANETAGDHFTPREVIQLMTNLLLEPDTRVLTQEGVIVTICDPTCGTGGMLAEAQNWIRAHNEHATVKVFGQDYNPRSYAVAASDLLIKGHKDSKVECGNTLTAPPFPEHQFDYLLANPPFGVDWKAEQKTISTWSDFCGYKGKLPRINDGALLFLLYMVSKFQPYKAGDKMQPGSRLAVVFNGSPLFTGGAGSGESDIRRWIIKRDQLEAIIALPEQMFYNTGIGTFVWVVTNRKEKHRKGKIQLIDGRDAWKPMKRSLGNKRRYLDQAAIDDLTCEHGNFGSSTLSKIFDNQHFGYRRVAIQRPLRLRFELSQEAKERYLDACPDLYDALQLVEESLGREPIEDWNMVEEEVDRIFRNLPPHAEGWASGAKGTRQKKLFRDCFTVTDPAAKPVIAKTGKAQVLDQVSLFPGQTLPAGLSDKDLAGILGLYPAGKNKQLEYEADSELKDFENIPLAEDVPSYFLREVRPFVSDAWIDRSVTDEPEGDLGDNGIGKVGYEINFNREFFTYKAPRPLKDIDSELDAVEKRIANLLKEVIE